MAAGSAWKASRATPNSPWNFQSKGNMTENQPKILIVDDEEVIRNMLEDFLDEKYPVKSVANAQEALAQPDLGSYSLVISDINMPGMPGYELLYQVKQKYPHMKTVLITAYNVDDYIRLAKKFSITNIITKTIPFNFNELKVVVDKLVSGNIFGLDQHLNPGYQTLATYRIRSSSEAKKVRGDIIQLFKKHIQDIGELKLVLDEIITNAIYHSPRTPEGKEKYQEFAEITLQPEEHIIVNCGMDNEKYAVSVLDQQGKLSKETILYKIDRHINAEGILDDSGRGIYLSRIFSDRLVVNIDPNKKTEVIIINYLSETYKGFKPLYINEL
jgi:YesN/AraC family two-component response regulator